ncbi:MAG: hypothetical protein KW793_03025 [Candidatus Doudnabacteria bacterium]|nr:hypothetical protein [Candidatus Doudnabacteria bacterium]
MRKHIKILIVAVLLIMGAVFVAQGALAKPQGNTRPGWGFGDANHVHTGPPGTSVSAAAR